MDFGKKFKDTTLSNGKKVRIKILPAMSEGIPIARRLFSIIAPAVGGTFDGIKEEDSYGTPRTFTELALTLCQQLDKSEVVQIIVTLLNNLEVDGKVVDLDEYFAANYGEMIEILEFSLKENFSTFFTGNGMSQRFQKVIAMILSGSTDVE